MKIQTIVFALFCVIALNTNAQGNRQKEERIVKKTVCLKYEDEELYFFEVGKEDEPELVENGHLFSLKKRYANIYMEWLNPLQYKITWSDSTYDDERDVILKTYTESLKSQFFGVLKSSSDQKQLNNKLELELENEDFENSFSETENTQKPFKDIGLLRLQWEIQLLKKRKSDVHNFANYKLLENLLKSIDQRDGEAKVQLLQSYFTQLFKSNSIQETKQLIETIGELTKSISDLNEEQKKDIVFAKEFYQINTFNFEESFFLYTKEVIGDFLKRKNHISEDIEELTNMISKAIELIENSYKNTLEGAPDYVKCTHIKFEEGKQQDLNITIVHKALDEKILGIIETKSSHTKRMKFRQYDIIEPTVSTGMFISTTQLTGFGVTTNDVGKLEISEDNIEENMFLAAAFLHLNFNVGSRYFSPLIELGIDPTKKRPFFLLGTGFTIPAVDLGISGGLIWTWDQELTNNYQLGDVIESTSSLESNLRYDFDPNPLGWYIGIHYNF